MKNLHELILSAAQHVPFLTPDEAYGTIVIGGFVAIWCVLALVVGAGCCLFFKGAK